MRAEEIIKESELYNSKGSAYLHAEVVATNPGSVVISGDEIVLLVTMYSLIVTMTKHFLPENATPKEIRKKLKGNMKAINHLYRQLKDVEVTPWEGSE